MTSLRSGQGRPTDSQAREVVLVPNRRTAFACACLAAEVAAIAVFALYSVITDPGTRPLESWTLVLALEAPLVLAADELAASAQTRSAARGFRMSHLGVEEVFLPARRTRRERDLVVYRSPLLRLKKAWYPRDGVPWAGIRFVVWGPDRNRQTLLANVAPARRQCGGNLLFPRELFSIPRALLISAASGSARDGSVVDLLVHRLPPGVFDEVRQFGTPRLYGLRLRLRANLTRSDLGYVYDRLVLARGW
jgi:hypothetical protein